MIVDSSQALSAAFRQNALDVAFIVGTGESEPSRIEQWRGQLRWFGKRFEDEQSDRPLPLVLPPQGWSFHEAAVGALRAQERRFEIVCTSSNFAVLAAAAAALQLQSAQASSFGSVHFDKKTDQLVVTMLYRGTNPNHKFTLKWGDCQADQSGNLPGVTAEVLDDQFDDLAQQDFKKTMHFSLAGLPCSRPASVTLRSAPRFFYTLTIPG